MRRRRRALRLLPALAVLACHGPARARELPPAPVAILLLLLPAVGPEARLRSDSWVDTRLLLSWPFQLPLSGPFGSAVRHRLVVAPEFVVFSDAADGGNSDTFLRLHGGYRYVHDEVLILGAGATLDVESTLSLAPELGVRTPGTRPVSAVLRMERSLFEDDPLRVNLLLGLSFY